MFSFLYHCQDFYRTWLYIWVTRQVSSKKQELITLRVHPGFLVRFLLFIFLFYCVVLLCVFTFWVPCCDFRYDFGLKRCSIRLLKQRSTHPKHMTSYLFSYLCSCCFITICICIVLLTTACHVFCPSIYSFWFTPCYLQPFFNLKFLSLKNNGCKSYLI